MKEKVLIFGIDGGDWLVINRCFKRGLMPTLKKLIDEGVAGYLESTDPPVTFPAWLSMTTGKNPGKIGYAFFAGFEPESEYVLRLYPNVERYDTIWRILSENDFTVGVFQVPTAYLPEKVNGFVVCGNITPRVDKYTYPPQIAALLGENFPRDVTDIAPNFLELGEEEKIEVLYKVLEEKRRAIKKLVANENLDFLMVVIRETDDLLHSFWLYVDEKHENYRESTKYERAVYEFFDATDSLLKELLEVFCYEESIVFVVSDHGFRRCERVLHLNSWLLEEGYIQLLPKMKEVLHSHLSMSISTFIYSFLKKFLPKIARSVRKTYERYQRTLADVDWSQTKAYALGWSGLYVNLKGREPFGIVNMDEAEDILCELEEKLRRLKDPISNRPLVKDILRKEELWFGEEIDKMPDLYVVPNEGYLILGSFESRVIAKAGLPGTHSKYGVFVAHGSGVGKGEIDPKIVDIAPTVLFIMDAPIPYDVDGRVLREMFRKDSNFFIRKERYFAPKKAQPHHITKEDLKKVQEKLRALGYLD